MYWEQVGAIRGAPVLFLHGGPGAGAGAVHRRFFDPHYWRVIIFDQRGAGRSRPLGSLAQNTTPDLVADIETLRRHLGIERWLLFGGSWGSTLALAYAQAHPERVRGLVLRGVFLGRPAEVDWFLHGLASVFPDAHAAFVGHLGAGGAGATCWAPICAASPTPIRPCTCRPHAPGRSMRAPAARCCPVQTRSPRSRRTAPRSDLRGSRRTILRTTCSCRPGDCWAGWGGSAILPGEIVQGRYDMICPARTAFELAAHWPAARLTVIPDAGHSALEPGVRRALVSAVERFRTVR